MAHTDAVIVFTTIANEAEAVTLIRELLDRRLIACGTIQAGSRSIYRWEGKIERQAEILLLAKTTRSKFEELEREVRALHSYGTPEIIALPIVAGSTPYLEWLTAAVKTPST